jgi:hypothetical protein
MADSDETEKEADLDEIWSNLEPEVQVTVINLFSHIAYRLLVSRTAFREADDDVVKEPTGQAIAEEPLDE